MTIKRDTELLFEIGCFRFLPRTWKRFLNPDVQNNAEHTLRVAWVALTLARHERKGDHEKIIKMALIHDLGESRCGDVDYLSRQYVERHESQAIKDIFNDTAHDREMVKFYHEYEKRECIEAKLVKDADNLDVEFELRELESRGHDLGVVWNKNRKKFVYTRLYTPSAKRMWREIHKANPHDWHLKGRNRFNAGDWGNKKR